MNEELDNLRAQRKELEKKLEEIRKGTRIHSEREEIEEALEKVMAEISVMLKKGYI